MSDCIKREDAIDRVRLHEDCDERSYWYIIESINDIPSADVVESKDFEYYRNQCESYERTIVALAQGIAEAAQRKHGEWIDIGEYPYDKCSLCGCIVDSYEEWNYCPNCGAYMWDNNEDEEELDNVTELESPFTR